MRETLLSLQLGREQDIVLARQRAREASDLLGFELQDQIRIAAAVSEIARNALQYGGGGTVEFSVDASDRSGAALQITVRDRGPGLRDVDEALAARARARGEPAMGIISARRLMDGFSIDSAPGAGTTVSMHKLLPRKSCAALDRSTLAGIARKLAGQRSNDAYAEVQEQNRELLRSLEELRLRQEELERLNAELEDTNRGVLALYAELDERAAQLRLADETKTRFLANVSHELRTPVNSILALSRLLLQRLDGDLTPEQVKQVTYIYQAAEQLGSMVDDLLDLRKLEAGKISVRIEPFNVSDLFGALRGMFKPLIASDDVALIFDDAKALPMLSTDQAKVAQILRNLISNALKFTKRGHVRVSAHLTSDGRSVVFEVADTGIGIPPEHHRAIFEEFTQVENPLQTSVKGTGLGLPLSQRLAGVLGGTIEVKSRLGEGSTFSLVIPVILQGEVDTVRTTIAIQAEDVERVLIIDDNEIERYALRQFLAPGSYEVIEATGGYDGLRLARQRRPDFIFLDLIMPDIHGEEILKLLQASEETRSVPVIIFTSKRPDRGEAEKLAAARALLLKQDLSRETVANVIRTIRQASETHHAFNA
jgi:signal transduction histidine kinase